MNTRKAHAEADALEAGVKDKVCARCGSQPRVAWYQSHNRLRCNCDDPWEPLLVKQGWPKRRATCPECVRKGTASHPGNPYQNLSPICPEHLVCLTCCWNKHPLED